MIPKKMDAYLKAQFAGTAIQDRLIRDGSKCFLEFDDTDEHFLSQLGITKDNLGPHLVACIWDEASDLEIGGYLVVDNLFMGSPSMGGIRMLPGITPLDIYNLARGMTLKNAAANLPYGGGKSGIVAESDISEKAHTDVIRGFSRLIRRYKDIYIPGPDVGTNDADMKTIAIENGLDSAVSKPGDMGGNRIDELGGAAGGVVISLQYLLEAMPRLKVLPQFTDLQIPSDEEITIAIQGFGAVGAHVARIMDERLPEAKMIGISDLEGYIFNPCGLPKDKLYKMWHEHGLVTTRYYEEQLAPEGYTCLTKFSTDADNLLRESAFCLVPATAVFNYLGVLPNEDACMSVDRMGNWSVIVEGANTYSPNPNLKADRIRMEQIVYREKGVMIANDYLVNSGGVIFAAQEHAISTPDHLQIPDEMLGNPEAVDNWLAKHADEFAELSENRLIAGEEFRDNVMRRNMNELIDLLTSDSDMLPCKAAEQISLQRLSAKENKRTAEDIMMAVPMIHVNSKIKDAAELIMKNQKTLITVLSDEGKLAGVVTTWDITQAVAKGAFEADLEDIMNTHVIAASPYDNVLDMVRDLEKNAIQAMPVVNEGSVLGMVDYELLANRILQLESLQKSAVA